MQASHPFFEKSVAVGLTRGLYVAAIVRWITLQLLCAIVSVGSEWLSGDVAGPFRVSRSGDLVRLSYKVSTILLHHNLYY
jgi:hypothetical protein